MIYNESTHKSIFQYRLQPSCRDMMKPCPFCGGTDVELTNTHTPHYWVECTACGAQVGDPKVGNRDTFRGHIASARRAIVTWNTRA